MSVTSIAEALFTKTQQRVLGLLYGKPDKRFYTNEIVRMAAMGRGTVTRELEKLTSSGILISTKEGNQQYYQANSDNPIFDELVAIATKTFGVADVVRQALKPVNDKILCAFIYGSVAKGEAKAKSDIDLLVISDKLAYADLMECLVDAEKTLSRPINPSVYELEQFKQKWQEDNAFISKVMDQPKIWLKGSENDISASG
ncbi:nucleotidyltransferase domain-containing protein [Methylophaga nitratireducenticrescens]|uniref:Nucleotidyltransferase n=1 Tax=Methylophaga nitratireducenticrescens TaxID=754476 RepID=I1XKR7_METNJ|nr:nucleotidyltransferase domain-containing protein [Methylophaga nitratireducenticrescens]AFI84986.1 transcriptional regulator [Methylophaga nitratireducenticrescens]AUZ84995.1 transcriptional regulator [Methylophaga nitratireducenticrescens]